jgi:hypothetical protein
LRHIFACAVSFSRSTYVGGRDNATDSPDFGATLPGPPTISSVLASAYLWAPPRASCMADMIASRRVEPERLGGDAVGRGAHLLRRQLPLCRRGNNGWLTAPGGERSGSAGPARGPIGHCPGDRRPSRPTRSTGRRKAWRGGSHGHRMSHVPCRPRREPSLDIPVPGGLSS